MLYVSLVWCMLLSITLMRIHFTLQNNRNTNFTTENVVAVPTTFLTTLIKILHHIEHSFGIVQWTRFSRDPWFTMKNFFWVLLKFITSFSFSVISSSIYCSLDFARSKFGLQQIKFILSDQQSLYFIKIQKYY